MRCSVCDARIILPNKERRASYNVCPLNILVIPCNRTTGHRKTVVSTMKGNFLTLSMRLTSVYFSQFFPFYVFPPLQSFIIIRTAHCPWQHYPINIIIADHCTHTHTLTIYVYTYATTSRIHYYSALRVPQKIEKSSGQYFCHIFTGST